jgi:hypothetical protein
VLSLAARHLARQPSKWLARAAYADLLPGYDPPPKVAQPLVEGPVRADVARHGPEWAARWLAGGALERAGVLRPAGGATALLEGVRGDAVALYRALALLGVEFYARRRLGLVPLGEQVPSGRGGGTPWR